MPFQSAMPPTAAEELPPAGAGPRAAGNRTIRVLAISLPESAAAALGATSLSQQPLFRTEVISASDWREGVAVLEHNTVHAVVAGGIPLGDRLARLLDAAAGSPVALIAPRSDHERLIHAMRRGVADVIDPDTVTPDLFIRLFSAVLRSLDDYSLSKRRKRLRAQNKTLVALAKFQTSNEADLSTMLRRITEASARTLNVDRVSIWRLNAATNTSDCLQEFDNRSGAHTAGQIYTGRRTSAYIRFLEENRIIAATNVFTS
ncbi:MAG: hypothetical protein KDD44_12395, partial [Bdellovibrionales bacterium]|nr:hypothetical protein [Bdellovibrionales bacterium]